MLRFSNKSTGQPRNYLRRREQRRLLLLVFLLGGTAIVLLKVSDPGFWSGMLSALGFDESTQVESEDATSREYTPYISDSKERAADSIEIVSEYERQEVADGRDRLPGVNLEYLAQVKDNRPRRVVERPAWLNLFEVLQNNRPDFIVSVARDDIGYVQLYWQPDEYRGQLVTLKGVVRRAENFPFGKNDLGIIDCYRLMLQVPAGAGKTRPVFVFALELPEKFPVKFQMREEVEVSGFSYKKLPYQRADGKPEIAPVLLAGPIAWIPDTGPTISVTHVVWATVGLAVMIVLGTWYLSRPQPLELPDRMSVGGSLSKGEAETTSDPKSDDESQMKTSDHGS